LIGRSDTRQSVRDTNARVRCHGATAVSHAGRRSPLQLNLKEPDGSMAAAAEVYRRVLKAVQKHVGRGATKQRFLDFGAAEFRAPVGTEADARARLRLAGDYAYLLTSVHHHKVLEIDPVCKF
jgi:hypothetical protein